jgi:hypothetical protein
MHSMKLTFAMAFLASTLLVVKVSADTPPEVCKYAQGLRKFQKPILNPSYPVDKKAGVDNTWDGSIKDLGIRVTGDFKTPAKYHLAITKPEKEAAGQYVIVATMPTGPEKWIWLSGKAACNIVDMKETPTRLAVATLDYAAMDARNEAGGRTTPCSLVTNDDMKNYGGIGGTQQILKENWPMVWTYDNPGTERWTSDMRSNRMVLNHLNNGDAFQQY